ncbi:hypothetical protein VOLCADRAFT_86697, partial [Volvox carteri f. nagariensis]
VVHKKVLDKTEAAMRAHRDNPRVNRLLHSVELFDDPRMTFTDPLHIVLCLNNGPMCCQKWSDALTAYSELPQRRREHLVTVITFSSDTQMQICLTPISKECQPIFRTAAPALTFLQTWLKHTQP